MIEQFSLATLITISSMIDSGAKQAEVEEYIGRNLSPIESTVLFDSDARAAFEEALKINSTDVAGRSWCGIID